MKRFIYMVAVLLGFALSIAFDGSFLIDSCDLNENLLEKSEVVITNPEALNMPMESPISYTNVSSVVLSSTYCRSLGKYRFNTIIPMSYDCSPVVKQDFIDPCGDSFLTSNLFSYAAEYFVFGQRRILI